MLSSGFSAGPKIAQRRPNLCRPN